MARRYPIEELHLEKDGSLVVTVGREAIALSLGQPPYRDKIEEAVAHPQRGRAPQGQRRR